MEKPWKEGIVGLEVDKVFVVYLVLPTSNTGLISIFSCILDQTSNTKLVTVQADEDPTLIARPMKIEYRRFTDVTHLSYASHCWLPRDALIFRLLICMQRQTLSFLSHHVAKLITYQTQDKFRFSDIIMRCCIDTRRPQGDIVLSSVFAWVFRRVEVPGNGRLTGFASFEFSEGVERTGDVALFRVFVE